MTGELTGAELLRIRVAETRRNAAEYVAKKSVEIRHLPRQYQLAACVESPSSIGPIKGRIRRQLSGWKSVWQSASDQRDGKTSCSWRRVRFAA